MASGSLEPWLAGCEPLKGMDIFMIIPQEVKDALLLLDMGQRFALTNFRHEETRRDVTKLRPHIETVMAWVKSIEDPPASAGTTTAREGEHETWLKASMPEAQYATRQRFCAQGWPSNSWSYVPAPGSMLHARRRHADGSWETLVIRPDGLATVSSVESDGTVKSITDYK